jgi:hypothetical protein
MQNITQTLSGDDSELRNAWDEVCVQVQYSESIFWEDVYLFELHRSIKSEVEALPDYVREAIWLQTAAADEWEADHEDSDEQGGRPESPPVRLEDIVEYVCNEYVLPKAGDWSNKRIRAYLDSWHEIDD